MILLFLYSISLFIFLCSRLCREISFQFRTRLPHGLLVYHNVKNPDGIELDPYALYVIVEKGQLKVVHVFGKHSTSVTVGEGLNRDEWHSVMVGKTPSNPSYPNASCSGWNILFLDSASWSCFCYYYLTIALAIVLCERLHVA